MKKILIIVPDGGMLFESAGIADILMQANRLHPEGAREICYQVKLATTQPHQVIHGQSGLNLLADHRLHEIDPREPRDTIMITGRGQNPQEGMAVVDWLRLAAPHARRIASICGGAMLLAQTGLLDGRRATTHWKLLETMQAEFPQVRVEGGPLYIQDEHIWTSGGVMPVVSIVDLTVTLERDVTVEEVNNAFREAAATGPLKGILGYSDEPLVSSDYQGDPRSSIIDGLSTLVIGGNMVKILAWYDNEWGFSNRLVDLALMMAKRES
ncbi:TPA: DJ-1/PfpI family protein [Klebsiella variicola]